MLIDHDGDGRFDEGHTLADKLSWPAGIVAWKGGVFAGNIFDDWGNRFLGNIRNSAEHVVLPARYLARNPFLPTPSILHDAAEADDTIPVYRISPPEPWRELRDRPWSAIGNGYITSSSGVTVYRGSAYPHWYHVELLLGEVSGKLIHRESIEPAGVTFRWHLARPGHVPRIDRTPLVDPRRHRGPVRLAQRFRPRVDLPLESPGFHVPPSPELSQASTTALVAMLAHHNGWHRDTAHRLIFERQEKSAIPPIRHLLHNNLSHPIHIYAIRFMK